MAKSSEKEPDRRKHLKKPGRTEGFYPAIFNQCLEAIIISEINGYFTEANKAAIRLTGYSRAELLKLSVTDLVVNENFKDGRWLYGQIITGEEYSAETLLKRKDGSVIHIGLSAHNLSAGKKNFIQIIIRDLTKSKLEKEVLNGIFNLVPDLICTLSLKGFYLKLNPAWEKALGFTAEELMSKPFSYFLHPDDVETTLRGFKRLIDSKAPGSLINRHRTKNGTYIVLEWHSFPSFSKDQIYAIARDITRKHETELDLQKSENRFRQIAEGSGVCIWELDSEGVIVYASPVSETLLGYKPEEIVGIKHFYDFFAPDVKEELKSEALRVFEQKGLVMKFENQGIHSDGHTMTLAISGFPILDINGNLTGYRGMVTDVTERNRTLELLQQSEEKYRRFVEDSPLPILAHQDGLIFYANPAALKTFGAKSVDEILQTRMIDRIHPEFRKIVNKRIQEVTRGYKSVDLIYEKLLRLDGSYFDAEVIATPFIYNNRAAAQVQYNDISHRLKAEKELTESEIRYRLLFNTMEEAFALHEIICDEAGKPVNYRFLDVNPSFEKLTGLKSSEIIGRTVLDVMPEIEMSWIEKYGNVAISGGNLVFEDFSASLARYYHVVAFCPEIGKFAVLFHDITEEKLYEKKIIESEDRYRTLFEHSVVPIWEEDFSEVKRFFDHLRKKRVKDFRAYFMKHPDKIEHCASLIRVIDLNQTSAVFFGVKDKSELITNLQYFFTKDSLNVLMEEFIALSEGKTEFESDIPVMDLSGEIIHLHIKLLVEPGHYESLSRVLVTWIDMTDRFNYEEMLKRSEEELRELAVHIESVREDERKSISLNLHDDLGQKLTAIRMDISWLNSRIGVQSHLVQKKLSDMSVLLDDTINTVQRISSDLRPTILYDLGLAAAIDWQINEFINNSGIACTLRIIPKDLEVDEKLSIVIFRIIQESLTNIARHSKATSVSVNMKAGKAALKILVRDNGIGIGKDKIESPKSFGLMGIRERARACGGEIKILGKPGEGTAVIIIIPWQKQ